MSSLANLLVSYKQVQSPEIIDTSIFPQKQSLDFTVEEPVKESTEDASVLNKDLYGFKGWYFTPKPSNNTKSTLLKNSSKPINYSDNLKYAVEFFKSKNLSKELISGILGNLMGESNLDPKAINKAEKAAKLSGYGRGIAQWSNDRVANFKKHTGLNLEDSTLQQQLDFAWHEMESRPAFLQALKNAKTVKEATDAVYRGFENGSTSALASPETLTRVYSKAWARLNYRPYNFNNELNSRVNKSNNILKAIK